MGISGRIARAFLRSRLTPLVTLASLAVGVLGILATPREEEPQISVPMIDVIAAMPGLSPREAENLLARPIEQRMLELPGVEHVYTMSGDGYAMVTVRFEVGEDQERSVTRVHAKLASAAGALPDGSLPPVVKPHSIDDVPVLTLTLHSARYDANALRQIAVHLEDEIRTVPDVSETFVVGGERRQIRVTLDPARLTASGVTPGEVATALTAANARLQAGELTTSDRVYRVDIGAPLVTPADVGSVVVGVRGGGDEREEAAPRGVVGKRGTRRKRVTRDVVDEPCALFSRSTRHRAASQPRGWRASRSFGRGGYGRRGFWRGKERRGGGGWGLTPQRPDPRSCSPGEGRAAGDRHLRCQSPELPAASRLAEGALREWLGSDPAGV